MENIKLIPISILLSRRRPICGTATLSSRHTETRNPNPIILNCLPERSLITGTLSLPSSNQIPPRHSYFSFSDDSGSVSCDVINFDFSMIGKKINVLSWNYIPFKKSGGLLEIINWNFVDDSCNVYVDSFSLGINDFELCCDSKAKYIAIGLVKSVSPVLIVDKTENVRGFIVEMLNSDRHDFVYFCGAVSPWHLAFSRIVGRVISLSRLKKKLVYVGKEDGMLMYVASEVTQLCFRSVLEKYLFCQKRKSCGEEKREFGMYIGVVKGVYMQGMVIELDEEVWLLMTDEALIFTCSVRVGAILHVRNVHIVNPKFRWGKMLILGACSKTNITTISFSPWETGCQTASQSQSLLRKFIDSLAFPARLWVLLIVQCFRKKLSGLFSEKELLGTKHKEGLVQTYARSVLPSLVFQSGRGLFTDFCKHDSCSAGNNVSYGNLSLGVPLSNFLGNCDRMWYKALLELKNGYKILEDCSQADHPFRENKLLKQPIRRILPSKDFGISLVGNLKLSQDTGRLQFTDATSCIDAVIPDLPSNWNLNVVFEVVDYTLVLEGRPGMWSQAWVLDDDLFSCSSIFRSKLSERQTELTVYVHFQWSNVRCGHFSIQHCLSSQDSSMELDPGIFHLLFMVHKFPLQAQFHGDCFLSDSCRLFAEVMVLPWDLNVVPSESAVLPENVLKDAIENRSYNDFAFKRCKTRHALSCTNKIEWCGKLEDFKNSSCSNSNFLSLPRKTTNFYNLCGLSPAQIPCTASVRGIHCQRVSIDGTLCYTQGVGNSASFHPTSSRKLLLEFNSKSMVKYELMQIGVCYIIKHFAGKCFCDSHDIMLGNKVAIDMETRLWSTTFHFNMAGSSSCSCNDPSSGSCSLCEISSKHHLQNKLVLHHGSAVHGSFFDVSLHISADATGHLNVDVQALQEALNALSESSLNSNGQRAGIMNTVVGNIQNQGACFGSSLPEGNLVSLRGTLISIHRSGCGTDDGTLDDIHLSKNMKSPICLLVLTDGQALQICGRLSSCNYPVGLAPGADVTFHRILALSGQNRLILIPVSFITVHSVKEASTELHPCFSVSEETIPSCLISGLMHSDVPKPKRLCGRVVGVYIVIFERNKNLEKLLSCIHSETTIVNIPLAGFILDDGSSRCFCWASGERAATFLRLHDEAPVTSCRSSWWRSKDSVIRKSCSNTRFHLNKILKNHERITVKNCGSMHDTLSQDLHLSNGSNCFLGTQDQNLLRLIIFNACCSTLWSITGYLMDSSSVNSLEKTFLEEPKAVHPLQNVWVRDVSQVDKLTEARALFQELKPGPP